MEIAVLQKRIWLARYRLLIVGLVASRSIEDIALKLLPILAKLGLALPAALLVHGATRHMTGGPARYRVLVIRKAVFNEDIREVLGECPDVEVFSVGRAIVKCLAIGLLPRSVCDDATYVSDDPATERAKIRYRKVCQGVWRYLSLFRRYDAVITGNWCYWAERELATVLEGLGTPFIVLHKEGIKPPERSKMLRDLFRKTRGRFTGRRVLVYHESERDHQLEGDIARADQIKTVGMPRLDCLHAWRKLAAAGTIPARSARPMVLVLAFIPNNFLPSYSGIESDLAWDELCRGTYRAVLRLARENPDIDVVVRPRSYELKEVEALLDLEGSRPATVRVVADGEIMPLIEASWVVCGHNTTVLLEGLAAGKPVVVPHFGEALDVRYHGYIVGLGEAVEHASSVDDLAARLRRHCASPEPVKEELSPAIFAELEKWTGNADGRASERVRLAIMQELRGCGEDNSPPMIPAVTDRQSQSIR